MFLCDFDKLKWLKCRMSRMPFVSKPFVSMPIFAFDSTSRMINVKYFFEMYTHIIFTVVVVVFVFWNECIWQNDTNSKQNMRLFSGLC